MSKYIKGFNNPFLKIESGNAIRIINTDDIAELMYYGNAAYIHYKSGYNHEINIKTAHEIDEFLMNHKIINVQLPGGITTDVDMMHDEQTLLEWLEENGQA